MKQFEEEAIPIILGLCAKNVSVNLKNTPLIDKNGIDSLIKISNITNRYNGKNVVCDVNNNIKDIIVNSDLYDYCFKSKTERSSVGVFNV